MPAFFIFILGTIGLTHIIVDSKIMQWFRDFADNRLPEFVSSMFHCYQCSGFWAGCIVGLIVFWPGISSESLLYATLYTSVVGFCGSFLGNWAAIYFNYLEARSIVSLPDDEGE